MRPLYKEFEDFAYEDSHAVRRMLRELRREDERRYFRQHAGPSDVDEWDDDSYEDYGDYDDYNEEEFDLYSK